MLLPMRLRLRLVFWMMVMLTVVVAGEEFKQDTDHGVKAHQQSADAAEPAHVKQRNYFKGKDYYPKSSVSVQCPTGAVCDDPDRRPLQLGSFEDDCPPGYGMSVRHEDSYEGQKTTKATCYPCKSGFFSKGLMYPCQPCGPGNGFGSHNGAGHQNQCFCLPGFGGPTCTRCEPGTFSPGGSLAPCRTCPNNANTRSGETSEEACGCPPGRGGRSCELCPIGTFGLGGTTDDGWDNQECTECPGAPESITTLQAGSKSQAACVCARGFAGPDCTPCTSQDQICPGGSKDPPLRCPGGAASSPTTDAVTLADCQCNPGYGRVDPKISCDGCGLCELCAPGSYSAGGFGACVKCKPGFTSPAGSDADNDCTPCAAGTYEKGGVCLNCPFGTTSTSSPTNPPVSEAACNVRVCPPGFGAQPCKGSSGGSCIECAPCPPGTYHADNSFTPCTACGAGQTSPAGATASAQCTDCKEGTYEEDGKCLTCPLGSTSEQGKRGVESCSRCLAGFGLQPCPGKSGCTSCQPCPEGTYQDPSTLTARATCTPCDAGKFSTPGATASTQCTDCQAGTYEEDGKCLTCPLGSTSEQGKRGVESCSRCLAGFGLQPCPGRSGCTSCQPCPEGTYQDAVAPGNGERATCQPCPAGKTSAVGATAAGNCFCKFPGYGGEGSICTLCPVGSFAVGPITGSPGCKPCPVGQTTLQPGAGDPTDCVCAAGYGWNTGNTGCEACSWPFYQGHLDSNLVPVTSATKENPHPRCLECNLVSPMVLGNAQRQCVTSSADTNNPPVYCVDQDNPLGLLCPIGGCTKVKACTYT